MDEPRNDRMALLVIMSKDVELLSSRSSCALLDTIEYGQRFWQHLGLQLSDRMKAFAYPSDQIGEKPVSGSAREGNEGCGQTIRIGIGVYRIFDRACIGPRGRNCCFQKRHIDCKDVPQILLRQHEHTKSFSRGKTDKAFPHQLVQTVPDRRHAHTEIVGKPHGFQLGPARPRSLEQLLFQTPIGGLKDVGGAHCRSRRASANSRTASSWSGRNVSVACG